MSDKNKETTSSPDVSESAVERLVSTIKAHMADGYDLANMGKGWWLIKHKPYKGNQSYGPFSESDIDHLAAIGVLTIHLHSRSAIALLKEC